VAGFLTALAAVLALVPAASADVPGSVVQTDKMWVCKSRVDLDSVTVTMTKNAIGDRRDEDAIHLQPGCTGRIGRIDVTQWAADGVKVADGVHDLVIGGGRVRCFGKAPGLHQDGIQVMGGARITFRNLAIDCGRPSDRLINSNLFIRRAGRSVTPPTDVVCDGCTFGGWAAHTVSVQESVRSGVTGSSLCLARFPQFTLSIGPEAVDPVGGDNTVRQCGPGQLTIGAESRVADYPARLRLDGLFLAQTLGSPVTVEARPFGRTAWKPVAAVRTNDRSRWQATVRPAVQTSYRARLGGVASPALTVRVRPRVVLKREGSGFLARVAAGRSFQGRPVVLQRLDGETWVNARMIVLGRRSRGAFSYRAPAGVQLRLFLPRAPGYLAAYSEPLS